MRFLACCPYPLAMSSLPAPMRSLGHIYYLTLPCPPIGSMRAQSSAPEGGHASLPRIILATVMGLEGLKPRTTAEVRVLRE